jgi:aldose 1-epimerase
MSVDLVTIRAGSLEAAFAPALGMVGCSLTHRGQQVLGLRGGLDAYAERGSTMGIPLLHPWANRLTADLPDSPLLHRDANGLPIHGVLPAAMPFVVREHHPAAVVAGFDTARSPQLLEVFPHPHRLLVQASIAPAAVTIRTSLVALEEPVPVAFGYHPYLSPPGGERSGWRIEAPVSTRLVLDQRMIPTGEREPARIDPGPLAERVFDDGYAGLPDGSRFSVTGHGLRLDVTFVRGYRFAQVYAPAGEPVVAFEPMTAPTDALVSGDGLLTLAPGERHTAEFAIGVTDA